MYVLLLATALAVPPTDLDGDGKPETITIAEQVVRVGKAEIPCESMDQCMVEVHDVLGSDKYKELAVCAAGPRDDVYCGLWRYDKGRAKAIPFPDDSSAPFTTSGNGLVLTKNWEDRLYERIVKYKLAKGKLVEVPQPAYYANTTVHIDRTFPIYFGPKDQRVVANVRPDSDVVLVLESATHEDWYLVRVSSGLLGWTTMAELWNVSDQVRMLNSAG